MASNIIMTSITTIGITTSSITTSTTDASNNMPATPAATKPGSSGATGFTSTWSCGLPTTPNDRLPFAD